MKNKVKLLIFASIIAIVFIIYIFQTKTYKTIKIGNTINKSAEEIKNYILNISSYDLTAEVTINSNKNKNKYIIKQKYEGKEHTFKQEIIEPENIKGLITIYDGKSLKIENSNLKLSHIYENYPWIGNNNLCLNNFIEDYKESDNTKCWEEENKVILETKKEKYIKTLYINKENMLPCKLIIQNSSKNILVYIEYKEIKTNKTEKQEILAQNI